MQGLMSNFGTIVLYIGAIDAFVILLLGLACAGIYLFKLEAKDFWERIVPATLIIVATSLAAGVVMLIARWVSKFV